MTEQTRAQQKAQLIEDHKHALRVMKRLLHRAQEENDLETHQGLTTAYASVAYTLKRIERTTTK